MTTRSIISAPAVLMLAYFGIAVAAQEPPASTDASKHRLVLQTVSGVQPRSWVFAIVFPNGHIGLSSPEYLREYIADMVPAGVTLEWDPGCLRRGGEPLLGSPRDLAAFAAFLHERKIHFVLVPSG